MSRLISAVSALFLVAAVSAPAEAQSRADFLYLQDRVQRLEAQMGAGGFAGGNPQDAAQTSLRIGQLEEQVRQLTGQVQEATFRAQQLEEQLRRFQEDVEFRFRDLQGGGLSAIPDPTPPAGTPVTLGAAPPAAGGAQGIGTPPQTLGTLSVDQAAPQSGPDDTLTGRPLDLSALAAGLARDPNTLDPNAPVPQAPVAGDGQELAVVVPSDPRGEFELGYSFVIARDYAAAEGAFRQFLATYPQHELAGDAQYWIGETLFARGRYREAADAFLATYTDYGSSPQAPAGLLKLSLSLVQLGEPSAACRTLGELSTRYPAAAPEILNRAGQERARLGC